MISCTAAPTQILRLIFTNTAEFLMGVTADELNQPKFAGLEELSYPELHEVLSVCA